MMELANKDNMKRALFIIGMIIALEGFSQGSGSTLRFDGVNDWVSVPNSSSLNMTTNNFSIEFWVKRTSNYSDYAKMIAGKKVAPGNAPDSPDKNAGYDVLITKGAYQPLLRVGDGSVYESSRPTNAGDLVPLNEWTHICFVYIYSTHTATCYINGEAVPTSKFTTGNIGSMSNSDSFKIAHLGNTNLNHYFPGEIDELRVWNDARTLAEIQDNMCKKLVGNESGLVGYWQMNEGSGTTVFDETVNNNDGTLN